MDFSSNDAAAGDKWIIEMVDKGFVGEYTSHVLDLEDKVHIVYFDYIIGNLKHAKKGPDGWIIENVDQEGTVGQYLSVTKDKEGRIYISHRDQGQNRLKMAVFDGNRWNSEVVDTEPWASLDTSICVDASGTVYISYYNFSQGYLKLAVRDKGQWKIEVVDDGQKQSNAVGGFSCVKVDSSGRVHISYIDSVNGLLKYAVKENDAWTIELADDCEFVGNFTSLALDKDGNPYISYTVDKEPNKPDLWLARKVGGKWTVELVDTARVAGNYNSIVVDQHANIYISYSAMRKLKLAKNIQGTWSFEPVDPDGTITYTSLSLDTEGMPHIAYHDKDRGVKYAHKERAVI
jgi:frataxin-like iron-binding protein CyaY